MKSKTPEMIEKRRLEIIEELSALYPKTRMLWQPKTLEDFATKEYEEAFEAFKKIGDLTDELFDL